MIESMIFVLNGHFFICSLTPLIPFLQLVNATEEISADIQNTNIRYTELAHVRSDTPIEEPRVQWPWNRPSQSNSMQFNIHLFILTNHWHVDRGN